MQRNLKEQKESFRGTFKFTDKSKVNVERRLSSYLLARGLRDPGLISQGGRLGKKAS